MVRGEVVLWVVLAVGVPGLPAAGGAAAWPAVGFDLVADGFQSPVHVSGAGDGSGRVFVVERAGRIRSVTGTAVATAPFLDIRGRVLSDGGEQGLLSVAFPPDYAVTRKFYVDYTAAGGGAAGRTVISRFGLLADDAADPDSEEVLLSVNQPFPNHNGGQIAFGPDGYLYVGMGDGGSGGDPGNRAQNKRRRLGKILRVDAAASTPGNLVLPADNPFVGRPGNDAVWAYGLRNPWRFSFDRATGDLYVADVGQNDWEEIDFQRAGTRGGRNYGWNRLEGRHAYPPGAALPAGRTALPVAEYAHGANDANGCAVTGGFVSRGAASPAMGGIYFFGDLCTGKLWGLRRVNGVWRKRVVARTTFTPSSFGEDDAGNLYLVDYAGGSIYKMRSP